MPESILEEAQRIIYGDRSRSYGHPRDNFGRTAKLFEGVKTKCECGRHATFTPEEVALFMVCLKLARATNQLETAGAVERDTTVDIAGYAGTLGRLSED